MRSNLMYDTLRAADQWWNDEIGDPPIEPQYLRHLAEYLTTRGWVQIHNENSEEGRHQLAIAEEKILQGINDNDRSPQAIASDVFIGLLNPTRHLEEGTS